MSDSDDDVPGLGADKASGRSIASRPKGRAHARWEAGASRNYELLDGADGGLEGVLGGIEEAAKRKRYPSKFPPSCEAEFHAHIRAGWPKIPLRCNEVSSATLSWFSTAQSP
jgi:transcription initiation factor TFIIH subunit 2